MLGIKDINMMKAGDTLTVRCEVFSIGGQILMQVGDKVKVRDVEIEPARYSNLYPDIWYPPKLRGVLLEDRQGVWLPSTFYESWIGEKVIKVNFKKGVEVFNRKKFKSGKYVNTVKEVIDHPVLHIPAYTFEEDESYVECRRCQLAIPGINGFDY